RWAVEVAAAGGHHLLLTGPPGAGKSMLARRLPGLMPTLDVEQALETTRVHSAAGLPLPPGGLIEHPPFRSPHHTISYAALIGGGSAAMRPGEISLATNGILFVDEIAEVPAYILDCLRQPLEEGRILVCRARASVTFPARFLLVGAMNPCPCGQGQGAGSCTCSDASRQRYERRLSGPLLDRFDLRIPVNKAGVGELMGGEPGESSAVVAARVAHARSIAAARGMRCNAELPAKRLDEIAPLTTAAKRILEHKLQRGELSARGLHRIRRVSRTLADLADAPQWIDEDHVCAALELRVESRLLARAS
ncbi:MAG TPA: ATP-binding protein, partial [Acidimicrobiales bacterium]|nr:ATP-binding protein [Acidimicrobiales bacterium]